MKCTSCEMLAINGTACHETGCPDAWRDTQQCEWCGQNFLPENRYQTCCEDSCFEAYST